MESSNKNNINTILKDLFLTTGQIGYRLLDEAVKTSDKVTIIECLLDLD